MAEVKIPQNITKVDRSQFLTYLDTTPNAETPTYAVLGIGVTDYGIAYNPQVGSEKWIIEDTARHIHSSNEKQGSVSQTIYKNDPCFEFINNGRDKLEYKTHILDVDRYNGTGSTYPAKLSDGKVTITNYMGENATIEYDLYYEGDAKEGTVTFAEDGTPTFVASSAL